jgi:DNA-binding transcriptional ArsR family regulator
MIEEKKCKKLIETADVFKALGDINRLAIISILASETQDKICVGDLAKKLEITQPATSQHLRTLKSAKFIESKKEGNFTYYKFNPEAVIECKRNVDELFNQALKKCKNTNNAASNKGSVENE